jgi:Rap1a immunity proteins
MPRLWTVALALTAIALASQGHAEENRGSAAYLLPLCRTWLDLAENDWAFLQNMGKTEPARLAAAGVCVGAVFGVLEDLRSIKLTCPPSDITNLQLIRTVLSEVEKHPDRMKENFVMRVRVAMVKAWPCRKKGVYRSPRR